MDTALKIKKDIELFRSQITDDTVAAEVVDRVLDIINQRIVEEYAESFGNKLQEVLKNCPEPSMRKIEEGFKFALKGD